MEILKPAPFGIAGSDVYFSDQPRLKLRFGPPRSRITIEIESETDICKGDGSVEDREQAKAYLALALQSVLAELEAK